MGKLSTIEERILVGLYGVTPLRFSVVFDVAAHPTLGRVGHPVNRCLEEMETVWLAVC